MKYLILLSLLFIPNIAEAQSFKNDLGISMTQQEIINLENAGFSEQEISFMNQKTFDEYKNGDYISVSKKEKYIKSTIYFDGEYSNPKSKVILEETEEISKEEYNNIRDEITPRGICGSVSTTYKLLTSDIQRDSQNNRYKYKANLEWKKMPKVRAYDIIGIGIDNDVSVIGSSTTFSNSVKYSNGDVSQKTSATETRISSTGIAKYFPLFSDKSGNPVKTMVITMIAPVQKKTTNTITVLNNYSDYAHGVKSVSFDSIDVGISAFGLSFGGSTSIPEYDSMSTAQAIYDGIKW